MNHSLNPEKVRLIEAIKAIYRANRYQPRGKPLEKYTPSELRTHLEQLQAGRAPWITRHAAD